jgi:hypothetical protein
VPLSNLHTIREKIEAPGKISGFLKADRSTRRHGIQYESNHCSDREVNGQVVSSALLDVYESKLKIGVQDLKDSNIQRRGSYRGNFFWVRVGSKSHSGPEKQRRCFLEFLKMVEITSSKKPGLKISYLITITS